MGHNLKESARPRGPHSGKPIPPLSDSQAHRFWMNVDRVWDDDTFCWEWLGCLSNGYGQISLGGENFGAHRVAYQLEYGSLSGTDVVCHTCDNRRCCRPSHLFRGTQYDNMDDMRSKMRGAHYESHAEHGLTEERRVDAAEIAWLA